MSTTTGSSASWIHSKTIGEATFHIIGLTKITKIEFDHFSLAWRTIMQGPHAHNVGTCKQCRTISSWISQQLSVLPSKWLVLQDSSTQGLACEISVGIFVQPLSPCWPYNLWGAYTVSNLTMKSSFTAVRVKVQTYRQVNEITLVYGSACYGFCKLSTVSLYTVAFFVLRQNVSPITNCLNFLCQLTF